MDSVQDRLLGIYMEPGAEQVVVLFPDGEVHLAIAELEELLDGSDALIGTRLPRGRARCERQRSRPIRARASRDICARA